SHNKKVPTYLSGECNYTEPSTYPTTRSVVIFLREKMPCPMLAIRGMARSSLFWSWHNLLNALSVNLRLCADGLNQPKIEKGAIIETLCHWFDIPLQPTMIDKLTYQMVFGQSFHEEIDAVEREVKS
uniref:Uncharacterized protein n=1 Tax=Romanomermis culicivorax TaxID=13658 RepID=A0A915JBU9_ROMCU